MAWPSPPSTRSTRAYSDRDITARRIILQAYVQDATVNNGATTLQNVDVNVYGYEPQPFITEVFYSNYDGPDPANNTPNNKGYIAVELYNPYPFPISLAGGNSALWIAVHRSDRWAEHPVPPDTRYGPTCALIQPLPVHGIQPLTGFTGFSTLHDGVPTPPGRRLRSCRRMDI